jgi:very-short-patch-repair endonuclease
LEDYDGYKHVDISIPWAKLNIEIDGRQHLLNAKQLYSDLERDSFSHEKEIRTVRIPNEMIERNLDELADSLARVARKRYREEESGVFLFLRCNYQQK